jgi:hypothetical protein
MANGSGVERSEKLNVAEIGYLLHVTPSTVRSLLKKGAIADATYGSVLDYQEAQKTAVRPTDGDETRMFYIKCTDAEAAELRTGGFDVIDPRVLRKEQQEAALEAARARLRKLGAIA